MIDFNRPPIVGTEQKYFQEALESGKLCGDGNFTKRASAWLENKFQVRYCYLTTSCTAALEMGSWLCSLEPGDCRPQMLLSCAGQRLSMLTSIRRP